MFVEIIERKKERNMFLFAVDMIVCLENPKECTKKTVELISEFSTIVGYKINILKSVIFLCTSN